MSTLQINTRIGDTKSNEFSHLNKADAPSRYCDLGIQHLTTMNIGDLLPIFETSVQPRDKFELDTNITVKADPLIAPAFAEMDLETKWFFVPHRTVSSKFEKWLQNAPVNNSITDNVVERVQTALPGVTNGSTVSNLLDPSDSTPYLMPQCYASFLSYWLAQDNGYPNFYDDGTSLLNPIYGVTFFEGCVGSFFPVSVMSNGKWYSDSSGLGASALRGYYQKRNVQKLCRALGIPQELTLIKWNRDFCAFPSYAYLASIGQTATSYIDDPDTIKDFTTDMARGLYHHEAAPFSASRSTNPYYADSASNPFYICSDYLDVIGCGSLEYLPVFRVHKDAIIDSYLSPSLKISAWAHGTWNYDLGDRTLYTRTFETTNGSSFSIFPMLDVFNRFQMQTSIFERIHAYVPSERLINLLPFLAYQKICDDWFRDQNREEPHFNKILKDVGSLTPLTFSFPSSSLLTSLGFIYSSKLTVLPVQIAYTTAMNSVFGLRRLNYDKDLFNNAFDANMLAAPQSNANYLSMRFKQQLQKYAIKKALTGSKFSDWLANFLDTQISDVRAEVSTYLGGRSTPIVISETLQTSESSVSSAQGNRSGNANSYQNGEGIYFNAPDFGTLICIAYIKPRKNVYINGLDSRWSRFDLLQQNLPDFQNSAFVPVMSDELYLYSPFDSANRPASSTVESQTSFDDPHSHVFAYLPLGYDWKTKRDIISGDYLTFKSYWHQNRNRNFAAQYLNPFAQPDDSDSRKNIWPDASVSQRKPVQHDNDFNVIGGDLPYTNVAAGKDSYINQIFAVLDQTVDHFDVKADIKCRCLRAITETELLVGDHLV